jgi:large subunit ribosomal protein L3
MATALLGKKLGMTRIYDDKGVIMPVTVIQAGPCTVMQVKTEETDGYNALQLGFGDVKASRRKKPAVGHAKQANTTPKSFIREVRLAEAPDHEIGDTLTVEVFQEIQYVDVVGTTKGRGFAGVMKRHGYKGQLASHGVERKHRSPGSISVAPGATGRSIKKGKKMAGHMGCVRKTTRNHLVVGVDTENHLLLVKGSVAGGEKGYVMLSQAKTKG